MKKQLLKLFNEAGFHQPEMERLIVEHKFEKFAELIIKESCSQVREIDAMEINKHFGVES